MSLFTDETIQEFEPFFSLNGLHDIRVIHTVNESEYRDVTEVTSGVDLPVVLWNIVQDSEFTPGYHLVRFIDTHGNHVAEPLEFTVSVPRVGLSSREALKLAGFTAMLGLIVGVMGSWGIGKAMGL